MSEHNTKDVDYEAARTWLAEDSHRGIAACSDYTIDIAEKVIEAFVDAHAVQRVRAEKAEALLETAYTYTHKHVRDRIDYAAELERENVKLRETLFEGLCLLTGGWTEKELSDAYNHPQDERDRWLVKLRDLFSLSPRVEEQ